MVIIKELLREYVFSSLRKCYYIFITIFEAHICVNKKFQEIFLVKLELIFAFELLITDILKKKFN